MSDEEVREYMMQFDDLSQDKDFDFVSSIDRQLILQLAESSQGEFHKALDYIDSAEDTEEALENLAQVVIKITEAAEVQDLDIIRCYLQEMLFRLQWDKASQKSFLSVLEKVISGNN